MLPRVSGSNGDFITVISTGRAGDLYPIPFSLLRFKAFCWTSAKLFWIAATFCHDSLCWMVILYSAYPNSAIWLDIRKELRASHSRGLDLMYSIISFLNSSMEDAGTSIPNWIRKFIVALGDLAMLMILDEERAPLENVAYSNVVPKTTVVWYLPKYYESEKTTKEKV